jgi:hypothetical protein
MFCPVRGSGIRGLVPLEVRVLDSGIRGSVSLEVRELEVQKLKVRELVIQSLYHLVDSGLGLLYRPACLCSLAGLCRGS